ncbi:ANKRD17 [Symbiodinium necroappetens]|uniref:ANKRD17 protein n=1 Tax=Symbiodinium necroappetens TaxID=1628268 RepID=A0A812VTM0_9DINO|nr:ANKRD17 [Symbiodinium necroappetens]
MVESRLQLEQLISEGYTLDERGRYEPVIDLSFLNMSSMKDSCSQIRTQMQKQEEDKRKQEQAKLQAELDEEDTREDQQLLQEAGDLSYKVPTREWDSQFAQDNSPQKVADRGLCKLEAKVTEQRITRYMTAEPDDKGVVKVYIDDPDVANASKESIHVSFTMSTYTVRVGTSQLGKSSISRSHLDDS